MSWAEETTITVSEKTAKAAKEQSSGLFREDLGIALDESIRSISVCRT